MAHFALVVCVFVCVCVLCDGVCCSPLAAAVIVLVGGVVVVVVVVVAVAVVVVVVHVVVVAVVVVVPAAVVIAVVVAAAGVVAPAVVDVLFGLGCSVCAVCGSLFVCTRVSCMVVVARCWLVLCMVVQCCPLVSDDVVFGWSHCCVLASAIARFLVGVA